MSGALGKVTGRDAGDRAREAITVEQLLTWAYAVQMVHLAVRDGGLPGGKGGPRAAASTVWTEGSPIAASRNQGFDAAEDAWRIHDEVMKLPAISVDCGQDLAAARYHALGQYRGAEPPVTKAATVDATGSAWPTNGMLDIDVRGLVMIHASRATRPPNDPEPEVRFKPGDTVWNKKRQGAYAKGWFCHVKADGTLPGEVVQAHAIYCAWHDALRRLAVALLPIRLTMFSVKTGLPPPPKKPRLTA